MTLARSLETLHRHLNRQWAAMSTEIDISYSEFEYLRAIKDQEARKTDKDDHGQHLQDVVAEMGVRKASASAMVVKLEQRGLIERFPCRFDARAQHIVLTSMGESAMSQGERVYEAAVKTILAGVPKDERKALESCLSHIT